MESSEQMETITLNSSNLKVEIIIIQKLTFNSNMHVFILKQLFDTSASNIPQVMIQGTNGELKMLSLADLKSLGVNLIEDIKSDDQIMG